MLFLWVVRIAVIAYLAYRQRYYRRASSNFQITFKRRADIETKGKSSLNHDISIVDKHTCYSFGVIFYSHLYSRMHVCRMYVYLLI